MAKSIQLRFAIFVCWFFALTTCSAFAYAAEQEKKMKGLEAIAFDELKYVWPIIFCAAILSTLTKMANRAKIDCPPANGLPLEIAKDLFGSVCAGGVMFLMSTWFTISVYEFETVGRFILIFFAAYGGSRFIEIMYDEGFIMWGRNFMHRLLGRSQGGAGGQS